MEDYIARIATALEDIAQLMKNSEKREINIKKNEIKESNKAAKKKQTRQISPKESK
jgi:hypothetical protein